VLCQCLAAFTKKLIVCGKESCPEVFFNWGLAKAANLFGLPLLEWAIQEIGLKQAMFMCPLLAKQKL
jgi:hypothetical protein